MDVKVSEAGELIMSETPLDRACYILASPYEGRSSSKIDTYFIVASVAQAKPKRGKMSHDIDRQTGQTHTDHPIKRRQDIQLDPYVFVRCGSEDKTASESLVLLEFGPPADAWNAY